MNIKAVLFDLDGTLLDTHKDLGNALNQTLIARGKSALPMEDIRDHVSNGANALVKLGFGNDLSATEHEGLRKELLDHYLTNIATHTETFDGIDPLLLNLVEHKLIWGIVTNKPRLYTDALLQNLNLPAEPQVVVCPDDVGVGKPDPKPLYHACTLIKCEPNEVIYVGDHQRDIDCAIAAGMPSIAVGYGFIDKNDNYLEWKANFTAPTASCLWPIIHPKIATPLLNSD